MSAAAKRDMKEMDYTATVLTRYYWGIGNPKIARKETVFHVKIIPLSLRLGGGGGLNQQFLLARNSRNSRELSANWSMLVCFPRMRTETPAQIKRDFLKVFAGFLVWSTLANGLFRFRLLRAKSFSVDY